MRAAWGNRVRKNIDFSLKIEPKSKEKSRKTAHAAKINENVFLGSPFFAKSRFSVDFRGPAWRHFGPKSAKKAEGGQHFWVTKTRADDGSVPRAVPEASRGHSEGSEDPPEAIFDGFLMIFVWQSRAKVDRKIHYGMLENAGGLRQKSCINSEDALGTPIRRASYLGVRRSRASVLNIIN